MAQRVAIADREIRNHEDAGISPFICQTLPSVCDSYPLVNTFISQKMPLIGSARFSSGFTITELMIVLTIAGILATLAVPGMNRLIQNQRLSGQANEMIGDLAYARSEAIRRQARVTICKTSDPNASDPVCNTVTTNAWTPGRLIFEDSNADGDHDTGETVLRIRQLLDGNGNKLNGDGSVSGTANNITFLGNGMTTLVPGAGASENQLFLCDSRGAAEAFAIIIGPTGRARIAAKGTDMNDASLTAAACP
jgi:type IV fimbrial biogenesis protein FimT